ncbi:MAG: GNAT family N-acetyltransferase [Clostridia bacterium]|nr:GNAT family N-acetyltransferase [Clostridia bacterium]
MFEYVPASPDKLKEIWEYNIAENPGDGRWIRWGAEALENNRTGRTKTFLILHAGEPVGEGTLIFDPACSAVDGRLALADGETVTNVNALRIRKAFENRGHVSALMKRMERYARERGFTRITIGVEAKEARNLAIYLHWGYTDFICHEFDGGELILYYGKKL